MGYQDVGINPAVAGSLEHLGWSADEDRLASILPPIVRGTNAVITLPPAPAWAASALGALLGSREAAAGRILLLTAPALIPEWGALLRRIAGESPWRIEAARGTARATRRLKGDDVDLLITSPENAVALHSRSALGPDRFVAVVFAWPEDWDSEEAIAVLLQDLPRDAQRLVLTSAAESVEAMGERYARKAVRFGTPMPDARPAGPVQTLPAPWSSRASAIAELLEVTDPTAVTIWTADQRDHPLLRERLGGLGSGLTLTTRSVPSSGSTICYDLPDLDTLRLLVAAGPVTLLVPPGTERYVSRIAAPRRPVQVESSVAALLRRDSGTRTTIAAALGDSDAAALYLLGPLFEQYEPQRVAAGLYQLWQAALAQQSTSGTAAVPQRAEVTPVGGVRHAKVWVGVGKKDDATVADLVAVLVREVGLDRALIGRIELRDTFTMVEVPADDAERIAQRLVGLTIRRRKLSARVDTGRASPERPRGRSDGPIPRKRPSGDFSR